MAERRRVGRGRNVKHSSRPRAVLSSAHDASLTTVVRTRREPDDRCPPSSARDHTGDRDTLARSHTSSRPHSPATPVVMKVHHADVFAGPSSGCYGGTVAAETSVASHVSVAGRRIRENGAGGPCCDRPSSAAIADSAPGNRTNDDEDDGRCDNCSTVGQHRSRRPRHRSGSWP